ncbi:MAG: ImuA family protein [Paracoccaceae bacterium]
MDLKNATHLALVRYGAPGDGAANAVDPLELVARMGRSGVHELVETAFGDAPAATGLALAALASARAGAILWVAQTRGRGGEAEHGRLLGHGARAVGLDPGRLLSVRAGKRLEALWTVEEGLRSGAVSAVVAEIDGADFTASRRLSLAAEAHGVPLLLLMPHDRQGTSAAQSRWRVAARPSAANAYDPRAPGCPRWQARLERSRLAPEAAGRAFELEFDDATLSLRLVPGLAARPAATRTPGSADRHARPLAKAG